MTNKLSAFAAGLLAYAVFAAFPTLASATNDPDLTYPPGTMLAPGSSLRGTNVTMLTVTDPQTQALYNCSRSIMTTTLTTNNGSELKGVIETLTFEGTGGGVACTKLSVSANSATNGLPWCISSTPSMATDGFQIRGDSCSNKARPIRLEINGCVYERPATNPIAGTYATSPEDALLSFKDIEFPKVGGFFCASPTFLDITYTLEVDIENLNPVYIS
jgi:hypothetical protein